MQGCAPAPVGEAPQLHPMTGEQSCFLLGRAQKAAAGAYTLWGFSLGWKSAASWLKAVVPPYLFIPAHMCFLRSHPLQTTLPRRPPLRWRPWRAAWRQTAPTPPATRRPAVQPSLQQQPLPLMCTTALLACRTALKHPPSCRTAGTRATPLAAAAALPRLAACAHAAAAVPPAWCCPACSWRATRCRRWCRERPWAR